MAQIQQKIELSAKIKLVPRSPITIHRRALSRGINFYSVGN